MIEQAPGLPSQAAVAVVVLPHRSLSRPGLLLYFIAQSIATLGFALLAAWRGIVLAPLFALLVLVLLGYCLNRVWRASGKGETLTLTPSRLEIATAGAGIEHFHPYWVRVRLSPGRRRGWSSRLLLGSHGREVEVGAFLNEAERRILAQRLTDLLQPLQAHGGSSGISRQGDSE